MNVQLKAPRPARRPSPLPPARPVLPRSATPLGADRRPVAPPVARGATRAALEAVEQRHWVRWLSPSFVVSACFFGAAISTGTLWLIGPAIVLGPILGITVYIVLMLGSDANTPIDLAPVELTGAPRIEPAPAARVHALT